MAEPTLADHESRIAELERMLKDFLSEQLQHLRDDTKSALDRASDIVKAQVEVQNAQAKIDGYDRQLSSLQDAVGKFGTRLDAFAATKTTP